MKKPLKTGIISISNLKRFFLIAFTTGLILFSQSTKAQGDLLLYPKRIVFEGSKKSQTLNLANSGKDTVRYLISVIQVRMKQDGGFENIIQPDSGQNFADKYFRFFPRSVVLAPNEAQSIKIQLINNSQRQNGEYRSHLYFRAEAAKKPLGEVDKQKDSLSVSVNLTAVFGISIPIIIRVGESNTQVNITEALFRFKNDSIPSLKVSFNRIGNMSVYGDISVDHISIQGKITRVGIVKRMAIYTPNQFRDFELVLEKNPDVDYQKGRLHIKYSTQPDANSQLLAETILQLKN